MEISFTDHGDLRIKKSHKSFFRINLLTIQHVSADHPVVSLLQLIFQQWGHLCSANGLVVLWLFHPGPG